MRSVWKGSISFGMVVIPASLYTATEDKSKSPFHLVHRACQTRVKSPRVCPTCDCSVDKDSVQKVYEIDAQHRVFMEDADFANLPLKTLKSVEIVEFVDPAQIDPRTFDKSYFLAPDELGLKAFLLLRGAMEKSGLAAVGKLGYGEKEHLCILRPFAGAPATPAASQLLLQTLFYADELKDSGAIGVVGMSMLETPVTEADTAMAMSLISALKVEQFDLSKFHDEYRQALYQVIEAKAMGKEIEVPEAPVVTQSPDLSAMMEASIAEILAKKAAELETAKVTT